MHLGRSCDARIEILMLIRLSNLSALLALGINLGSVILAAVKV